MTIGGSDFFNRGHVGMHGAILSPGGVAAGAASWEPRLTIERGRLGGSSGAAR